MTRNGVELNGDNQDIDAVINRTGPNSWRLRDLIPPKARLREIKNTATAAYDERVKGAPYSSDNASPE